MKFVAVVVRLGMKFLCIIVCVRVRVHACVCVHASNV